MDELLKQVFCSIGATYLVLRFGRSVTSLAACLARKRAYTKPKPVDPEQR